MLEIAQQYKDQIQFAFKPHPHLISVLYNHPDWGKEKTDNYYNKWKDGENTQLELGEYLDLFKESDAMIHDCCSFSIEYLITGKPVQFISDDIAKIIEPLNEFGRDAIRAHYQGQCMVDILSFLDDVVLAGKDPMREERARYREVYLTPPAGRKASENIYQDMIDSLGF